VDGQLTIEWKPLPIDRINGGTGIDRDAHKQNNRSEIIEISKRLPSNRRKSGIVQMSTSGLSSKQDSHPSKRNDHSGVSRLTKDKPS
jgi:hypothetical protein